MAFMEEHGKSLIQQLTMVRRLDGLAWSLASFYALMIFTFQDIFVSSSPFICCVPLFLMAFACLRIPVGIENLPKWNSTVKKLQIGVFLCAFNFPFLIFIEKGSDSLYLSLCSFISLLSLFCSLGWIAAVCQSLAHSLGDSVVESEAKIAQRLIWSVLVGALLLVTIFLIMKETVFMQHLLSSRQWGLTWRFATLFFVFPLILPLTLLFRIKFSLLKRYKDNLQRLS
ncbi:MAG: hypothetical protein HRT88_06115 [Lentisphaeraceae bacterium]|nr:hypothetical protein [Lentisphaeraceae bacterium]